MAGTPTNAASVAWLLRRRGAEPALIWGLTPEERLRRTLRAAGCAQIESVEARAALPAVPAGSALLLLRSDFVFDERLVRALLTAPGTLLVTPEGVAVAAHVDASRAQRDRGSAREGSRRQRGRALRGDAEPAGAGLHRAASQGRAGLSVRGAPGARPRDRAAHLLRLLQRRDRPRHQMGLAAPRRRGDAPARRLARASQHGHDRELAARRPRLLALRASATSSPGSWPPG